MRWVRSFGNSGTVRLVLVLDRVVVLERYIVHEVIAEAAIPMWAKGAVVEVVMALMVIPTEENAVLAQPDHRRL